MVTKFQATIVKGNKNGAGFVRVPVEVSTMLTKKQPVCVTIGNDSESFYGTISKYSNLGFFVPQRIAQKIIGKTESFSVESVNGFVSKIGSDGRIYVPLDIAAKNKLGHDDIILLEGSVGGNSKKTFSLVSFREHNGRVEYKCIFDLRYYGKYGVFNIENLSKTRHRTKIPSSFHTALTRFIWAPVDEKSIVLFHGNKTPVVINSDIDIKDITYYLGAYFADGTRKGNNWGICASTFEQANYYLAMHKSIIKDPVLKCSVTYTNYGETDIKGLKERLCAFWNENCKSYLTFENIRVIPTTTVSAPNRNINGAFVIKELKQLTLNYYNKLLDILIDTIIVTKDKYLALDFIAGVLEGDGSASAKARGHIHIATNAEDLPKLREIFKIARLRCNGYIESGKKASIRVGSLEIIENYDFLASRLFVYYPKRRKILNERLLQTGSARYILSRSETSPWVKNELQEAGILNQEHELTKKGDKIKQLLVEAEKSVTVR